LTVNHIRRAARRLLRQGLRLIVVDYLQLLTPADERVKRYEQVGKMSAGLKEIARTLGVPVLCLSQLNRESVAGLKRARKLGEGLGLHQLRESGSIEQDADVVMLLDRIDNDAVCQVAANRNGPTFQFRLTWVPGSTRFDTSSAGGYAPHGEFADFT